MLSSNSLSNSDLSIVKKITLCTIGFSRAALTFVLNQLFPQNVVEQIWCWQKMDHPLLPSVKVWFLDFYKGEMKDLLAKAKFGGEFSLFEQMIPKDLPLESAVLVPVPQGRWRFANRGFNQSEIIAQTLALRHNLKVSNCLKDLSGREAMHFKSRQGRLARGKKIMVNRRLVSVLKTRQVVLVDDILTTGATVKACVDALADSGITVQVIVVLAYTKRKRTTV